MKKMYHLSFYLTEDEWDAWRFCASRNAESNSYARRRYPAHYYPHVIPDNDGKGNPWIGFICWYHYRTDVRR